MATATTQQTAADPGDQVVVLRGVGWAGYKAVLRARGERPSPRMVYLDGDLWLMSPSFPHEGAKHRLNTLVVEVAVGLGMPFVPAGSTTYRRRKKRGGVEPDESYYLAHWPHVRDRGKQINLRVDPPPDLVIEVVYSHDADAAVEVCRRLGVPEVWVYDETGLGILVRQPDRSYAKAPASASFPFLSAAEIEDWLRRPEDDETRWILAVRRWVQETLAPRYRGRAGD